MWLAPSSPLETGPSGGIFLRSCEHAHHSGLPRRCRGSRPTLTAGGAEAARRLRFTHALPTRSLPPTWRHSLWPSFEDRHIDVSANGGVVTLSGIVFSGWDLQDALRAARKAAGGRPVIDSLSIEEGGVRPASLAEDLAAPDY
jgi:2-polyprenyl-6-methoxyphenol hydroxylase-like FAD-dependent oxidoreductase